ncbi:MAG: anti-sigma factor [Rhizobiaceae bacterium]|nr:anti-sigma factor [Rhizobiaceae bacterium]
MNDEMPRAVNDDDLHAWADGRLDEARRAEIERLLAHNPAAAAEAASWKAQNEAIRALYAAPAPRPDERRLVEEMVRLYGSRRRASRLTAAAAAVGLLAVGVGAGIAGTLAFSPASDDGALRLLPQAARANYLIYTREARHAVEVGADEKTHLVTWLGKRLGSEIAAPDLSGEGFELMGGRLVPYRDKPGALLMYQNAAGQRLTLFFGRSDTNRETGFRFDTGPGTGDTVQTFYWIDGPVGYAISGEIGREQLERISELVYRQLPAV